MIVLSDRENMSFPEDLRNSRNSLGISQQELADQTGISVVMVGRYERGEAVPSQRTFLLLKKALEEGLFNPSEKEDKDILLSQANTDQIRTRLKELGWQKITLE